MTDTFSTEPDLESDDRNQKIQSLRDMIANAERTMQSAKAMLLQIEGKKRVGRPRKVEDIEDGTVVQGSFDGQIMQGSDGKQYPVPANYASKSKLIEGDILKLTITSDGSFIYKQIGPADRRHPYRGSPLRGHEGRGPPPPRCRALSGLAGDRRGDRRRAAGGALGLLPQPEPTR